MSIMPQSRPDRPKEFADAELPHQRLISPIHDHRQRPILENACSPCCKHIRHLCLTRSKVSPNVIGDPTLSTQLSTWATWTSCLVSQQSV